jgi:hypothetical protein
VEDQTFFNRPGPDLPARLNIELEHDVSHVGFDGSFADHEYPGDLAVAFPKTTCPWPLFA